MGGEGEGGIGEEGAGRGGTGKAARTGGKEGDVFGEMGEEEEGESGDRAGSSNKARLGGGGAALTVTEGWTAGRSGHAGRGCENF